MEKIWFMLIEEHEEGPFSPAQLRNHPRFTPDTLMRKLGSKLWKQARYIDELNILFEDEVPLIIDSKITTSNADELILVANQDPPFFYLGFLLTLILLAYILYRFFDSF